MLIKVFDSGWFDPTGIILRDYSRDFESDEGTFIKTGSETFTTSYTDPGSGRVHTPVVTEDVGIYLPNKTPDKVAQEINKQIAKTREQYD